MAALPYNPKEQHVYCPGIHKAVDVSILDEPMASQVENRPDSEESFANSQESVKQAETTQVSINYLVGA